VVKALCYKPEGRGFEIRCDFFSIYPILLAAVGLGFTQPLTEMSTRCRKIIIFLESKVRPVRRSDNLAAICEPIV
jgi:hypothetical protein